MSNARSELARYGKNYEALRTQFLAFANSIKLLEGEIPALKFGELRDDEFDFSFLGQSHRLRFEFERGDPKPKGLISHWAKNDNQDLVYVRDRAVAVDHQGNLGLNGAWPWAITTGCVNPFYFLVTGETPPQW